MILLTGDVMLGRGIDQIMPVSVDPILYESYMRSAAGYVEIAEEVSGTIPREVAPSYVWGEALGVLEEHNPPARIVNLETAATTADRPWPNKGIHYRMHPENVAILTVAGIDAAVLANNHVLDWGREGLAETVEALRRSGVGAVGAGEDFDVASEPAVIPVPDGRILVFAMAHGSSGVPSAWGAGVGTPGVHLLEDLSKDTAQKVARNISGYGREPGDRVIASIHWGGNWGYDVPAEQQRFARALIDQGDVDLVHGHSSHHPKGLELYRGRLIVYGAGDLINDYEGIGGREEFRAELSLLYLPELTASGELARMTLVPMRIEKFRLLRANREQASWLRDLLARESKGLTFALSAEGVILATP